MNALTTKVKNKKGFTLIELIVVIVIIGILAAIAIPRLSGFSGSANEKTILADVKTIETAAIAYISENAPAADFTVSELGSFLDAQVVTNYSTVSIDATDGTVKAFSRTISGKTYTYAPATRTITVS